MCFSFRVRQARVSAASTFFTPLPALGVAFGVGYHLVTLLDARCSMSLLQVGMVDLRWGGAVLYLPDALFLLQVAPGQGGRT